MTRLQRLKARLRQPFHFKVIDAVSYREWFGLKVTLGYVTALVFSTHFLVFLFTLLIIFFTPVREWIPGYIDSEWKEKQASLLQKLDYLEDRTAKQDSFINALQRVSGYVPRDSTGQTSGTGGDSESIDSEPVRQPAPAPATNNTSPFQPAGYTPRQEVRLLPVASALVWPAEGTVTRGYTPDEDHFALDIAAAENTTVYTVAEGYVILSEYSALTGYVIGIQHPTGLVSFYKHNQRLFKKLGDAVFAGEAIAAVGSTGRHTTGPHLHLELWFHGQPLDPRQYLRSPS